MAQPSMSIVIYNVFRTHVDAADPSAASPRQSAADTLRSGGKSGRGVVHVAPAPVLPGLGGLHDRVGGVVEVRGGVLADRGVAAGDVPALQALPQGDPLQALV